MFLHLKIMLPSTTSTFNWDIYMNQKKDLLALEIESLRFSYKAHSILNGINLNISRGEIFGILGANGAGKTTLMKLITGQLSPQKGTIKILGKSASESKHSIGYMPQKHSLYQELSLEDNLNFFNQMYLGLSPFKHSYNIEEILSFVDLIEFKKEKVLHLSEGMKQRLNLAIALINNPDFLILDEPTVGLDPEIRSSFWSHFKNLTKTKKSLFISSHTMDDASHCDKLAFLRNGKIIAFGPPKQLQEATGNNNSTLEDAFLYFVKNS